MYFNSPGEDKIFAVLYMGQQWEEKQLPVFVHLELCLTEKKMLACSSYLLKEDWCPLLRMSCRQQTVVKVSLAPDLYSSTSMTPLSFFPNHCRNTYSYMGTLKATQGSMSSGHPPLPNNYMVESSLVHLQFPYCKISYQSNNHWGKLACVNCSETTNRVWLWIRAQSPYSTGQSGPQCSMAEREREGGSEGQLSPFNLESGKIMVIISVLLPGSLRFIP